MSRRSILRSTLWVASAPSARRGHVLVMPPSARCYPFQDSGRLHVDHSAMPFRLPLHLHLVSSAKLMLGESLEACHLHLHVLAFLG